jgi:ribosomal protein S27AE
MDEPQVPDYKVIVATDTGLPVVCSKCGRSFFTAQVDHDVAYCCAKCDHMIQQMRTAQQADGFRFGV